MLIEDPLLLWTLVGTLSGIILGIAGTGGGVIAIPVLMMFGGYDVKEATGYGLLALTVGAWVSWFVQRENTIYPIAATLILFAGAVAFIAAPLKALSPHWVIIVLLNITCLFGIYSLWILRKPDDPGEKRPLSYQLTTATVGGALTGFLSTMTGLGGGVLVIPWLTGITRLRLDKALACSLLTVAVTAPLSVWRQGELTLPLSAWLGLIGSVSFSSVLTKKLISYIPRHRLIIFRKLTLTTVILMTMMRTLLTLAF